MNEEHGGANVKLFAESLNYDMPFSFQELLLALELMITILK